MASSMSAPIHSFQISIPQEELEQLHARLSLTRFPTELTDAGWSQGAPLKDIQRLHAHWLERFDWRAQEQQLNAALPQFTTSIPTDDFGDLSIHFVHTQSHVEDAIPLLFCHGWPGSFIEVLKILPGLVEGGKDVPAFHVVAPSVPGYGFSDGARRKGFGPRQCAEVCHKLMLRLGYKEYVTQGGDWGSIITRLMGIQYPNNCLASHSNMATPKLPTPTTAPLTSLRTWLFPFSQTEKQGLARAKAFQQEGMGYFKEHATKPQTIGYSQTDSPVGLLAWIYEKLHDWTDDYPWTDDEILTWISIYWFSTAGPVGGMRLYYEFAHDRSKVTLGRSDYVPDVKLGFSSFPKEITPLPPRWNTTLGPVVFQSEHERGGHFAAWECPDAIVSDLRKMFGKGGGAYKVVEGKSGFEKGASRL